jgi:hypothetical protein
MANRTKWTQERAKKFLSALSEGKSVKAACLLIKICRTTAYKWKEENEDFSTSWDQAIEDGTDLLEDEAWRRAVEGVEKPVGFFEGVPSTYVQQYSDSLLLALLKARRRSKFGDKIESTNLNLTTELKDEDNDILERFKNGG